MTQSLNNVDSFEWTGYLYHNDDLKKAGIDNKKGALDHYNTMGKNEKRQYVLFSHTDIDFKPVNDYIVVPFGNRCPAAIACIYAGIRKFSLPFDWAACVYPKNLQLALCNDLKDFIPDVSSSLYINKYNMQFIHFDEDIEKGICDYTRRIERFKSIMQNKNKIYFVYIDEDYLIYKGREF
jgi:hypothetical protein